MGATASQHEPLGGELSRGTTKPRHGNGNVFTPYVRASIRKSLRRRKEKRKAKENQELEANKDPAKSQVEGPTEAHSRKMDKLKRTLSLKKKKEQHIPESSKPHVWQTDEATVRSGTCNFSVKYLGCVEVFESRGMQVCEEALKVLRNSRRRPIRGILYVSGDGLRVVDDDTKGLLVDQTIEKVSFCAPDKNHDRGFSYICRDGTTRRWMCHGFVASRESGERLSHAVGCAFAACLERKQKRDQDSGVTMTFDQATSTFTRVGSFRQMTVTERLSDPQECKPQENPLPVKKVDNPHAIARPHATPQLLQRQGSFRVFSHLNQSSPFKRQLSLRLNDLPSNLERTRSMSLDNAASVENSNLINNNNTNNLQPLESDYDDPPARPQRNRLQSLPNTGNMAPIPESSPLVEHRQDAVSAMCQQVSAGLSLLSSFSDPFGHESSNQEVELESFQNNTSGPTSLPPSISTGASDLLEEGINWCSNVTPQTNPALDLTKTSPTSLSGMSKGEEWLAQLHSTPLSLHPQEQKGPVAPPRRNPSMFQLRSASLGASPSSTSPTFQSDEGFPALSNGTSTYAPAATRIPHNYSRPNDPFDAEWAELASQTANPNNPFLQSSVTKAFEVQM